MALKLLLLLLAGLSSAALFAAGCLHKKYKKAALDIAKINAACKKLRYGDIHARLSGLSCKEAENAVNRLFETILDREMMIKDYQQTLAEKNKQLEISIKHEKELKQAKEDFAAALAHDMKTPVTAELNSLEFLLEGRLGALNEKQTEILSLMKSSNNELKELIENILEVYKLENKELKLELQNTDLNSFLEQTAQEMQSIAAKNKLKITCSTDETKGIEPAIDRFQLKRAVKNLIQNAAAFSPEGSEIKIETAVCREEIKISVINQGAGISKQDLDLIFQKCFSTSSKFKRAGTGLGLYTAKQIMLAHKGNIEADISKTGSTAFILSLKL